MTMEWQVPINLKEMEMGPFTAETFARWLGASGERYFEAAKQALDRAAEYEKKPIDASIAFRGHKEDHDRITRMVGVLGAIGGEQYDWAEKTE